MKSKYYLRILILALFCMALTGLAGADSVVKTVYINGSYFDEATADAALSYAYNYIILGAEGNVGYRYNGYKGKLDEFAIYEGVLSEGRIAAHFDAVALGTYVDEVMSDNPLLYLRFEDANSLDGNPAVNSGSVGIDGTYVDGVTLSAGAVGTAAEFHGTGEGGVGSCVTVFDGGKEFSLLDVTIEFWMQSTADPNDYPRFFQHNGSWQSLGGYGAMYQPGQIGVIGGGETNYMDVVLNDGNWHHIVITYESTVLPPEESSYADTVMADNPLVYYRFEDASGANGAPATDIAERAYKDGVYINRDDEGTSGIPDIALVPGLAGKAAQFHGAAGGNGNCIDIYAGWSEEYPTTIAYDADGNPRQTLTVEFWMNSTDPSGYPRILQHNDGDNGGFGVMGADENRLAIIGGGTTWYAYYTDVDVFDGQWHYVAVTYDQIDGDMHLHLYIDGILRASTVQEDTGLTVPVDRLTLGADGSQWYVYNGYVGLLDEVAIYDVALDAGRIWAHYSAAVPQPYQAEVLLDEPVLYLRFQPDGPRDSSGNNYYVEYGADTSIRPAMGIRDAIYLNGGTGWVAAWNQTDPYTGENDALGNQYAFAKGEVTFEFWTKIEGIPDYGVFFQQTSNETAAPGIGNSGGQLRVLNGAGGWAYTGVLTPAVGEWNHYVLTYNELEDPSYAMAIQLYVNGERGWQATVGSEASPAKLGPELNHLLIGGQPRRGNIWNRVTGYFDEFAVYNRILSTERIAAHYQAGLIGLKPTSCEDIWLRGEGRPGDINRDCIVDLKDFAIVARSWLECNDPALFGIDLTCMPNW